VSQVHGSLFFLCVVGPQIPILQLLSNYTLFPPLPVSLRSTFLSFFFPMVHHFPFLCASLFLPSSAPNRCLAPLNWIRATFPWSESAVARKLDPRCHSKPQTSCGRETHGQADRKNYLRAPPENHSTAVRLISNNEFCIHVGINQQVSSSGREDGMYSGGTKFESWEGNGISWPRFSWFFVNLSRQTPE